MFNSKKYRFELSQVNNVKVDVVRNAGDLVNYIIGENQGLLDYGETGSLVVSKIEVSKKGEQVLFAQRLNLPMPARTNFDALLEPFYTRKKLDFDEQILEEQPVEFERPNIKLDDDLSDEKSQALEQTQQFQNEEDEEAYAPAPQIDLSDQEDDDIQVSNESQKALTEVESVTSDNERVEPRVEINVTPSDLLTEEAIKSITSEEMKKKDEEIARLRRELDTKENLEVDRATSLDKELTAPILPTPSIPTASFEDTNVLDVIQMVKTEANKRLNDFIAQETTKINAEIEALDTRDKIEPSLTKRFEDEKANKAEALNKKVDADKEKAIAAENARHDAALQSIQVELEASRSKQLVALKEEFANKLSVAIKEEYDRQTEQLNLILQGKTEELQLRQKAVNEGMKNTVAEVLEGFNTNHGEVIQTVERRKNSSGVISLHKRVG